MNCAGAGGRLSTKGHKGIFWDDGNVVCPNLNDVYMMYTWLKRWN